MNRLFLLIALLLLPWACSRPARVALPIPGDAALIQVNLTALRASEHYAAYKDDVLALAALHEECDADATLEALDTLSLAFPLNGSGQHWVAIIEGDFDAVDLRDCAKERKDNEISLVDVGGQLSLEIQQPDGRITLMVPIAKEQMLLVSQPMRASVERVMTGEAESLLTSPLYQATIARKTSDTVIWAVITEVPAELLSQIPEQIQDVESLSALASLPAGGMEVRLMADYGDDTQAAKAGLMIPMGLALLGDQLGATGTLLKNNLAVSTEASTVVFTLILDAATTREVIEQLQ